MKKIDIKSVIIGVLGTALMLRLANYLNIVPSQLWGM